MQIVTEWHMRMQKRRFPRSHRVGVSGGFRGGFSAAAGGIEAGQAWAAGMEGTGSMSGIGIGAGFGSINGTARGASSTPILLIDKNVYYR